CPVWSSKRDMLPLMPSSGVTASAAGAVASASRTTTPRRRMALSLGESPDFPIGDRDARRADQHDRHESEVLRPVGAEPRQREHPDDPGDEPSEVAAD